MKSNPVPVKKKDELIALRYMLQEMTRADVNRAYKLSEVSVSGLHKVARAIRQLTIKSPELEKVMHSLSLSLKEKR